MRRDRDCASLLRAVLLLWGLGWLFTPGAQAEPGSVPGARSGTAQPPDTARGRRVYESSCVACHGADGTGAMPGIPDLTAPDGVMAKPEDVLLDHVMNGFQGPDSAMAMPAKGGDPDLTEQDIRDVMGYMRRTFVRSAD